MTYYKDRLKWVEREYGLAPLDFARMLVAQDGLCAICRRRPATDVDHDHDTGRPRELLCNRCNQSLGGFMEDASALRAAADYLDRHGATPRWADEAGDDAARNAIVTAGSLSEAEDTLSASNLTLVRNALLRAGKEGIMAEALTERVNMSRATVFRNLKKLRQARIAESDSEGRWRIRPRAKHRSMESYR